MSLLYFAAGCLIVLFVHSLLRLIGAQSRDQQRRLRRYMFVGGALFAAVLFLRFGLPHLAAIAGGVVALVTVLSRLMMFTPMVRMARGAKATDASSSNPHAMSVNEAREALGVTADATAEEINAAYHQLMQKLHPDSGGNDYLASKLNQARDTLLQSD